jgi:hypothetical protein
MAKPANELDKYVTYTYHFELHAARSWDELKNDDKESEARTSRFECNETLVINTRKDAHQVIEDVHFDVIGPIGTTNTPIGVSDVKMTVKEPGGFSFIEKLKDKMDKLEATNLCNVVFGLKIIFVGRTADNEVEILPLRQIPLVLAGIDGSFSPEGGVYHLEFVCNDTMASTRLGPQGQHLNYAFIGKAISFKSKTIEDAFKALEKGLNDNYESIYNTELDNNKKAKKIVYKLEIDPKIKGELASTVKDNRAPDALMNFIFQPTESVTSVISKILNSCPDLCLKIAESSEALKRPLHKGMFMPVITAKVYPQATEVQVRFVVSIYEGGVLGKNTYEFDYFFAGAGKNIDVQTYNVKFTNVLALTATKQLAGAALHLNLDAQASTKEPLYYANSIHPNVTQDENKRKVTRSEINQKPGDVALLPVPTASSLQGFNTVPFLSLAAIRSAENAYADFGGAIEPEQIMTIRGHYKILESCISHPDKSETDSVATGGSIFAKVNIYMPDDRTFSSSKDKNAVFTNGKRKFFYDGYYNVYLVTNKFTGGVFTQELRMIMNEGFAKK